VVASRTKTTFIKYLEITFPGKFKLHKPTSSDNEFGSFSCVCCGKTDISGNPTGLKNRASKHLSSSKCKAGAKLSKASRSAMSFFKRANFQMHVPGPSTMVPTINVEAEWVCQGFWKRTIVIGNHVYDTALLLDAAPNETDDFYPVEGHSFEVEHSSGTLRMVRGTYKHRKCSGFALNEDKTRCATDWCCAWCTSIQSSQVFRKRLRRASEGLLKDHTKMNIKYLRRSQLVARVRGHSYSLKKIRKQMSWVRFNHLKSMARFKSYRDAAAEIKSDMQKGNVYGMIENIKILALNGTFEKRKTLHHYLIDTLANAVRQEKVDSGENKFATRGNRYHKSTKNLAATLRLSNGPKCTDLLRANLGGPHDRSLRGYIKKKTIQFQMYGMKKENFVNLRKMYAAILDSDPTIVKSGERMLCMAAEDETPIRSEPAYNPVTDTIDGLCGKTFPGHKCDCEYKVVVGDPKDDDGENTAYNTLVNGICESVFATYVSAIVIVPLCKKLPNAVVYVQPTCNRFDATPHVASKWATLNEMFKEVISDHLPLDLNGHGSDGDGRRALLQLKDMYDAHSDEKAYTLKVILI
jgi:hypothetical protein